MSLRIEADSSGGAVEVTRLVVYRGDVVVARLGCGAHAGFAGAPGVTGYVGWYSADDQDAGVAALTAAVERLQAMGVERIVGPMDGSTWHRYRLALPDPDSTPFLMEPQNPASYPTHFEVAGFRPHLEYETRRVRHPVADPSLAEARLGLERRGIGIRSVDPARFDAALDALHALSLVAFADNPYFTPIPLDEFAALYGGLRQHLDPELVRMAVNGEGRAVGFVLAVPDLLAPADEPRIVLKTLAVHPGARGIGLGKVLVDEINAAAARRGATVLHALMHVANASRHISERAGGELFRRYRLYAWQPG